MLAKMARVLLPAVLACLAVVLFLKLFMFIVVGLAACFVGYMVYRSIT